MSNFNQLDKQSIVCKLDRSKRQMKARPVEKQVKHKLTTISIGPGHRIRIARVCKTKTCRTETCKKDQNTSMKSLIIFLGVILGFVIALRIIGVPVSKVVKLIQSFTK
jgi:hypothetical protein